MKPPPSLNPFEPRPWREIAIVVLMLALLAFSLLAMTLFGARVLTATRAYVAGEGFYIKGQKDALLFLMRYIDSGEESLWEDYERSIAAPLADGRARRELQSARPDRRRAAEGLILGGNHPDDTDDMIWLFGFGAGVPEMRRAIEIWTEADSLIDEVDRLGQAVRRERISPFPNREVLAGYSARIHALTPDVDRVGTTFSRALGLAARRIARQIIVGAALIALLLVLVVATTAWWILHRMQRRDMIFRALIEDGQDLVTLHAPSGRLLFASSAVERLLGRTVEEVRHQNLRELMHPADRKKGQAAFKEILEGRFLGQTETRWLHRDGTWRVLETGGGPLPGVDSGVLLSSRDVTQRRAIEEQMVEMQRLESIGRLSGDVAHDFNNLLTTILAGSHLLRSELLESDSTGTAEMAKDLDMVIGAAGRASGLTRQLLAFARRQRPTMRRFDLRDLLLGSEALLSRLVGADTVLVLEGGSNPIWVRGDLGQLQQVLVNLVANARDALTTRGQRVWVNLSKRAEGGKGVALLSVSDDGGGIDEISKGRVFEPFYTTKDTGEGTGLGLAICHGIVKQHDGDIEIESEVGEGTRVTVTLPLLPPDRAAVRSEGSMGDEAVGDGVDPS
ncbi:MAG: PAS domain S-box protein [Thermoanaerobaculia bacterium]|nr:PAS domain S-box protein [Thermoanaerobaculia bacterium]